VTTLYAIQWPSGSIREFFVLFCVILLGPIVFNRFGLPGLVGLVIGGFVIGPHGFDLIGAGNQTVPELGQLGLLYLMFVAGLELDLHVLREYRRAAVLVGLLAFAIPFAAGFGLGSALGWSYGARFLLGALASSHTLILYPTLRDAGLGGNPAVAAAVGATVLTDTMALVVLSLVAGSETGSGSPGVIIAEIVLGLVVLVVVGLGVLPRVVDAGLRRWGSDRIARYIVIIVALLFMAMLAQVFGIEGIVGAFFAGLALNRLIPNDGPSMERVEFFGAAVFVPIFLVSIGLLLNPSVMFTGTTLELAAYICVAALGGKAIACWLAGMALRFSRPERAAMFTLTAPQAAATLAVTLIGFEIGIFGVSVVNAVLVLIIVSILLAAVLAQRVVKWLPTRAIGKRPLGHKVLVVTRSSEPSDAAVRAATLLSRPDGGHGAILIARSRSDPFPDAAALRELERRLYKHGFDGHVRVEIKDLPDAVSEAELTQNPSFVVVDDPRFEASPGPVPVLVILDASLGHNGTRLVVPKGDGDGVQGEVQRRLARGDSTSFSLRRTFLPGGAKN
jgi:Kef-type K+ transport system membrane component KefB